MTPETWQLARDLIGAAMELPEEARASFLLERCSDPVLRAEIEQLLKHASGSTADDLVRAAATDSHTTSAEKGAPVLGVLPPRFRVVERLGGGSFGDVYRVFDSHSQMELALKVLRNRKAGALYNFKQEFRSLVAFHHQNVARLYELIHAGNDWMLTMELVEGVPFNKHAHTRSTPTVIRRALAQLVDGLLALHGSGFLHRDIKPSNVLVESGGRVVLVDFGLVREIDSREPQDTLSIGGTPAYMAPEQISRGMLTEAADWYAVGAMLYEALTGRLPFEGEPFEMLRDKQRVDPVSPVALAGEVPPDLAEICLGLLRRDPGVRMTGREARRLLALDEHTAQASVATAAFRQPFVGRNAELQQLDAALNEVITGTPQIVHVTGASGIGKSAFVRQFLDRAANTAPDVVALMGRCHPTESVPYQGLDQIVDALARHLRRLSRDDAEKLLPRHFSVLVRLFPVLAHFQAGRHREQPISVVDPMEQRVRVFQALREMLGRLSERQPVVVAIDDVQWADDDALMALREIIAMPAAPPILLVLAYRSEDLKTSSPLRAWVASTDLASTPSTRTIELDGLPSSQVSALVVALAPPERFSSHALRSITEESDGSPFFVQELVRSFDDSTQKGRVNSVEHVVRNRLEGLTAEEREYLEIVAVAGQPTRIAVLDAAVARTSSLMLRHELLQKRLLRASGGAHGELIEMYHHRTREAVLAAGTETRLRECHRQLAIALERVGGEDPERLAFHFEFGGDSARATELALAGARSAAQALAFGKAARCYRQALWRGRFSQQERCQVLTELAQNLANSGHGAEAAATFAEAAAIAEDESQLRLLSLAASQYLRSGHLPEGIELFERVLACVGIRLPENRRQLLLKVLLERMRVGLLSRRSTKPPIQSIDTSARQLRELDACAAAAVGFSMVDPLRSAFFSTRFVRLATKLGEPRRLCLALAGEATQLCHTRRGAMSPRVPQLLARAADLAEQVGDEHAKAFVTAMSGTVAYLQGRWRKASELTDLAIAALQTRCTGVSWELCTSHTIGFVSRCAVGEWAENGKRLPALLREAETRDDRFAYHSLRVLGCSYVLDLVADDPSKARLDLEADLGTWSYRYYDIQRANAMLALVDIALYERTSERALATIAEEWPPIVRSQLLRIPTTFAFSHGARARAIVAAAADAESRSTCERLLKDAQSSVDALRKGAADWAQGLTALLSGGIEATRGNHDVAVDLLRAAEHSLQAAELTPFLMAAKWRLASTVTTSEGERLRAQVRTWIAHQGIQEPERFIDALAPGRWTS